MNGRIYDPLLGRFLSADVVVQDPGDLQSYNRYSYVFNNPLSLADPTGFVVWRPTETVLTEEQKKKMTEEQIAKVDANNARVRDYNKLVDEARSKPGGEALFSYLDGRKETFMYGNAASFMANTSKMGELTVTQIDSAKIENRQLSEVNSWAVPTFKGFEGSRYQQHDSSIMRVAIDFHFDSGKYAGGSPLTNPSSISPAMIKAWLIQESGGRDASSLARWNSDPATVNHPGDWSDAKLELGFAGRPLRANTGNPSDNIEAALKYLTRKGYHASGRSVDVLMANKVIRGTFDGWRSAFERYGPPRQRGFYYEKIQERANNPDEEVTIQR